MTHFWATWAVAKFHTLTVCYFTPNILGMASILEDIEAFLEANNISPTAFGDMAMKDRHLVRQVRDGRYLFPKTEAKVRRFMEEYVLTCGACDRRSDDPACASCIRSDCGLRQREAA